MATGYLLLLVAVLIATYGVPALLYQHHHYVWFAVYLVVVAAPVTFWFVSGLIRIAKASWKDEVIRRDVAKEIREINRASARRAAELRDEQYREIKAAKKAQRSVRLRDSRSAPEHRPRPTRDG